MSILLGETYITSNRKAKIVIKLGLFFALLLIFSYALDFNTGYSDRSSEYSKNIKLDNETLKISAISGKIHINNNWTAAKAAGICTGLGTFSNPYIIKDLIIDGGGSSITGSTLGRNI